MPDDIHFSLYKPIAQWSSTKLSRKDKDNIGSKICSATAYGKEISFNITRYVKECLNDPERLSESRGMILTSNKNVIVATSDNDIKIPYVKLTLKKLPAYISQIDSINPQ